MIDEIPAEPAQQPDLHGIRMLVIWSSIWLVAALPSLTDTSGHWPWDVLLGAIWCLLAAFWCCLPLASPAELRYRSWQRLWLTAGAIGALGLVLAITDLGLVARLYLCERQVADYVSGVAPGTFESRHAPRWIGLFQVDGTEGHQGAVLVYTSNGYLDRYGLAYAPGAGGPPSPGRTRFHHLYGPWYRVRWKF